MFTTMMITCGTSTLTNPARNSERVNEILKRNANARNRSEISDEDNKAIESFVDELIDCWSNYSEEEARANSAELNAFLLWQKQNQVTNAEIYCYLIHSDTVLGGYAAELVQEWLKTHNYSASLQPIEMLNTLSMESFEEGLSNLVKWSSENFENIQKDSSQKVVFNVAGGFKVMSGFTLLLGQFWADETIYIFDGDRNSLLSIPRMPISLNNVTSFEDNLDLYRRLSWNEKLTDEECGKLNVLWVRNGKFTPLGRLVWEKAKDDFYKKEIFAPSYSEVKLGKNFMASVSGLTSERIRMINERLDDLILFKKSGCKTNLKRLDYKSLKKTVHGCSHECDAWADADAKRLFCKEVDNVIVVERLDDALH